MKKKNIIILLSLIAITWWGYAYFGGSTPSDTSAQETTQVATGSISSSVKTTGNISPLQSTTLTFENQWVITDIYKKIWDAVKAGEVIAEIDSSDAMLDIRNAQISLANAQNNYNKLYTSTTESDRIRSKNTLKESESNLSILESEYTNLLVTQKNTLSEKESSITLLESKLQLAKDELTYAEKNISTDTTSNTLSKDVASAFLLLEEVNNMIPDIIDDFKEYSLVDDKTNIRYGDLSAKDPSIKDQTESTYATVVSDIATFTKHLTTLRNKDVRTFDETNALVKEARILLNSMLTLSTLIISEYNNSIEWSYLRADDISTIKTATRTRGTEISNKLSSINSTISTLASYGSEELEKLSDQNTITSKKQALMSAENSLSQAKKELEVLKTQQSIDLQNKKDAIEKQKNAIALNTASDKELVAGPTGSDIQSAKNSIASAQISLEKARKALEDYQIIAPFDGVINDIPWEIGDTTNNTDGILIENKNAYEIELSLDQIDIVKMKDGMDAKIVLDAFPTETYTGKLVRISAVPTETSGVVSYTAIVRLTIDRKDVYSKMSATVEIIIADKQNILTLSSSAITTSSGVTTVKKVTTSSDEAWIEAINASGSNMRPPWPRSNTALKYEVKEIITGVSSDGKTEIISGLSAGDTVIMNSVTNSTSATAKTTTSSTKNTGGFGGGPPWGGGF